MKIDKYLAYKIAGSGFKLLEVSTGKVSEIKATYEYSFLLTSKKTIFFDQIGTDYKIISRTMDLTKPITLHGKEVVPELELTKLTNTPKGSYINYENGLFYATIAGMVYHIQNQIFDWLEKHHFCYFLPDEMIVKNDDVYNN